MQNDGGMDGLRKLAEAGVEVLGNGETVLEHACRPGTWLCIGAIGAAVIAKLSPYDPLWIIAFGFVVGYILNERERKQIVARVRARQASFDSSTE